MKIDDDISDVLSRSFNTSLKFTPVLPSAKIGDLSYTSEAEIRERVMAVVRRPKKKLSPKQLHEIGADVQPFDLQPGESLQSRFQKGATLTEQQKLEIAEDWIARLTLNARKANRLMTDTQLADYRIGRRFVRGDRARYVGRSRDEVTQAQLIVPRDHGQTGIITSVHEDKNRGRLITFHPDEPVAPIRTSEPNIDKQFVDLQIREYAPGWLNIERIPEGGLNT